MNSAKPKLMLIFGSDWLKTDGSTRPGPGLTRNVKGAPIENQIRPPAILGIVAVIVLPGAPSEMDTFWVNFVPVEGGFDG